MLILTIWNDIQRIFSINGTKLAEVIEQEAFARFNQANRLDCRISASHATDWRKGLNKLIAPDFLFNIKHLLLTK